MSPSIVCSLSRMARSRAASALRGASSRYEAVKWVARMHVPRTSAAQSGPSFIWFEPPPGWNEKMKTNAMARTARPPRRLESLFTEVAPV